jgi:hypothetical protein
MPETELRTCAYHIVRYAPNLIRDEWVNVGVVLFEPSTGNVRARLVQDAPEFARIRRLHPEADENLLRNLSTVFDAPPNGARPNGIAWLAKLEDILSNAVQLSPRKGLLAEDFDAELDRIYHEQVEPVRPARAGAQDLNSRSEIRARARDYFRLEGILSRMQAGVRVDAFTYPGDPMRLDFSYRRNGTRGYIQSVALGRDPSQAKLLAFTADAIRSHADRTEFTAITEIDPERDNMRHRFLAGLLEEKKISIVPLRALRGWAHDLAPTLRAN